MMINDKCLLDFYGSHNLLLKVRGCSKCPYCLISGSEFVFIKNDKGRCQKKTFFWDFVPNIGPHPPTAHVWDSTK